MYLCLHLMVHFTSISETAVYWMLDAGPEHRLVAGQDSLVNHNGGPPPLTP